MTSSPANIQPKTRWRKPCGAATSACRAAYSIAAGFALQRPEPATLYHRPVDRLADDLSQAYDKGIQAPGKETHFLILLSFLLSFGFIRGSAHMIKAQVSWWPGNVETKGGTHVHHMVWGILLIMVCGYIGLAVAPDSPWREVTASSSGSEWAWRSTSSRSG